MNKMSDAAAMGALESLGMGGGGGGMPMPEEMMADPAAGGGGDVEGALATIEGALAGAPPDVADEARTHINALREITSQIGGAPPEEVPPPEELPTPAPGQEIP